MRSSYAISLVLALVTTTGAAFAEMPWFEPGCPANITETRVAITPQDVVATIKAWDDAGKTCPWVTLLHERFSINLRALMCNLKPEKDEKLPLGADLRFAWGPSPGGVTFTWTVTQAERPYLPAVYWKYQDGGFVWVTGLELGKTKNGINFMVCHGKLGQVIPEPTPQQAQKSAPPTITYNDQRRFEQHNTTMVCAPRPFYGVTAVGGNNYPAPLYEQQVGWYEQKTKQILSWSWFGLPSAPACTTPTNPTNPPSPWCPPGTPGNPPSPGYVATAPPQPPSAGERGGHNTGTPPNSQAPRLPPQTWREGTN